MGSELAESLRRRRESQTQEPLGQVLAREFLIVENTAQLMANGERNGLPVGANQLIYSERSVAIADESLMVPTLVLYTPDEQNDALLPFITCHLLVTPEGAIELAHIAVTQSTLTDAVQSLPKMKKTDVRLPITLLDIDVERDTVIYRTQLQTQTRSIIPITTVRGINVKGFTKEGAATREVSVVSLNMETDELVVRKTHQTLFWGEQVKERGTGLYGLGNDESPGILRQILTQFTDAEHRLLQEEGLWRSKVIPRTPRRRKLYRSQTL